MHRSTAGLSDSTSKLHARASGESAVIATQRTFISFVNVTGRCGRTDSVAYDSDETGYPSKQGLFRQRQSAVAFADLRLPYPTEQF